MYQQAKGFWLSHALTGAFYVGLLDGLLGVAGMMTLLVMKWIIPENSLRLAPVSWRFWGDFLFFSSGKGKSPMWVLDDLQIRINGRFFSDPGGRVTAFQNVAGDHPARDTTFVFFLWTDVGNEPQTCGVTWREHLNRKWIFSSNLGFL